LASISMPFTMAHRSVDSTVASSDAFATLSVVPAFSGAASGWELAGPPGLSARVWNPFGSGPFGFDNPERRRHDATYSAARRPSPPPLSGVLTARSSAGHTGGRNSIRTRECRVSESPCHEEIILRAPGLTCRRPSAATRGEYQAVRLRTGRPVAIVMLTPANVPPPKTPLRWHARYGNEADGSVSSRRPLMSARAGKASTTTEGPVQRGDRQGLYCPAWFSHRLPVLT